MTENSITVGGVNTGLIAYPEGRYEKYESRIRKISRALAFIRVHKIAISIGTGSFAMAVLTFMFLIGVFIGGFSCNDFIYGEPPAVTVNAFLADVTYEYTSVDAEMWSDLLPLVPGEYRIRAVSENPFGIKRYTDGVTFTLKPRKLTLKISDTPCQYGDLTDEFLYNGMTIDGIANGDSIADTVFRRVSESWELVDVTVVSYRIVNADGRDATAVYDVTEKGARITVLPRKITVTTEGGEKEYDGLPTVRTAYEITDGSLVHGDSLSISLSDIPADAGVYTVYPDECVVVSEAGEDITYKYNITVEAGEFTVIPRPLAFKTGEGEKIYDGTPVTNPEWEHTGGTLLQGHTFKAEAVGSRTVVGESLNLLKVTVSDSDGTDVTGNYQMIVEEGVLRILPIVLNFSTESAEKEYDGTPLTAAGYEHTGGELLSGHKMECFTTGEQTDVGESKNTLKVVITGKNGDDITEEGYKIVTDHGLLRVTPRPIVFASEGREKYYDGFPLTYYSSYIKQGYLAVNDQISGTDFTGSQTEVGESPNFFTVTHITGLNGKNKIKNYDISYEYGTLRVLPSNYNHSGTVSGIDGPGGVDPGGNQSGGDVTSGGSGVPGGSSGVPGGGGSSGNGGGGVGGDTSIQVPPADAPITTVASIKLKKTPFEGFRAYLRATSYGSYTGSGFAKAMPYQSALEEYVSSLDFIGRNAREVAMKESILEIERLDGCPVLIPYYSLDTQEYFGQNDVYFESDIMKYDYTFYEIPDLASVMELNGLLVNDKQETSYRDYAYIEYLQIPASTKNELLRIAEENGIGAYDEPYILITEIQNFIMNSATYNLNAEPYPAGADVAVYFLEEAKEGICQHFAAAATMMYRAFGIPARYVTGFVKEVAPNTRYDITSLDAHAWVEIYLSGIGWVPVEVTGSGAFELPDMNKNPIVIRAYSASKQYDGMPCGTWGSDKYSIVYGKLLPGHTISVTVNETGYNAKTPGKYLNEITQVVIYDKNGKDVTREQYVTVLVDGETVIEKRKITIKTASAQKVYDGQPLTCEDYYIVSGSLPPNTTLTVVGTPAITKVGKIDNTPVNIWVYEDTPSGGQTSVKQYYQINIIPGTLTVIEK